jgi:hypothetical protein
MTRVDVDLFVIGGDSGGLRAARVAASHGAHVLPTRHDKRLSQPDVTQISEQK